MFPDLKQRALILIAAGLGGWAWLAALPWLRSATGFTGVSLFSAGAGLFPATAAAWIASLPAIALGLAASVRGHPLAGVFSLTLALAFVAVAGGPTDGWVHAHSLVPSDQAAPQLPRAYRALSVELLAWIVPMLAMLAMVEACRARLRAALPRFIGVDTLGAHTHFAVWDGREVMAALSTAVCGGLAAQLLLRTHEPSQVLGGLFCAFALGGLLGQTLHAPRNPLPMLLTPIVVAAAGYLFVQRTGPEASGFLRSWYGGAPTLPGLARALPVHYASAGIAGVAFGIGWAQALAGAAAEDKAEAQDLEATASEPPRPSHATRADHPQ